jgi:hypothetical protein
MPHRRRALNPTLPPPPPAATAFHLGGDEARLPLLADYALLHQPAASAVDAPASSEWSAGSAFTATSDAATTTASSTATAPPGSSQSQLLAAGGRDSDTWVRRAREGYYLQLSLAIRLTSQAFLAGAPPAPDLLFGCSPVVVADHHAAAGDGADDSEAISYRLWVGAYTHPHECIHGPYEHGRVEVEHTSISICI